MTRHYGLYAGSAKVKRAICRKQLEGLTDAVESRGEKEKTELKCRTCGMRLSWRQSIYPMR